MDGNWGLTTAEMEMVRKRYGARAATEPLDMRAFLAIVDDVKAERITIRTIRLAPGDEAVKGSAGRERV